MNLIELIIYVLLLAVFLSGSLAGAYGIFLSAQKEYQKEQQKEILTETQKMVQGQQNGQGGFIALISVFLISSALMMIALTISMHHGDRFDMVLHSEYRLIAQERALSCVDMGILGLAQDYFYEILANAPVFISHLQCTIDRIYVPDIGKPYEHMIVASAAAGSNIPIRSRFSTLVSVARGTVSKLHEDFIIF